MLERIHLTDFKSFVDEKFELAPFTVLVGPNASGKSNLIDAILFLSGLGHGWSIREVLGGRTEGGREIWPGIRGGVLEATRHGRERFSIDSLWHLLDGYFHAITCEEGLVVREAVTNLFEAKREDGQLRVTWNEGGTPRGTSVQNPSSSVVSAPSWPQSAAWMTGFKSMLQRVTQLTLDPSAMRGYPPKPQEGTSVELAANGENLSAVLWQMCRNEESKREVLAWISELCTPEIQDIGFDETPSGEVRLRIQEADGAWTNAKTMSDGTLLFLGLITAIRSMSGGRILLIEEIGNQLHPTRMSLLVDLVQQYATSERGAQIIATTHSPELLDAIPESSDTKILACGRSSVHYGTLVRDVRDLDGFAEVLARRGMVYLVTSGWLEQAL